MFDYGGIRKTMVDFHGVTRKQWIWDALGYTEIFRDMI